MCIFFAECMIGWQGKHPSFCILTLPNFLIFSFNRSHEIPSPNQPPYFYLPFWNLPWTNQKDQTGKSDDSDSGGKRITKCTDHWRLHQYRLHPSHPGPVAEESKFAPHTNQWRTNHQRLVGNKQMVGQSKVGPDSFQLGTA